MSDGHPDGKRMRKKLLKAAAHSPAVSTSNPFEFNILSDAVWSKSLIRAYTKKLLAPVLFQNWFLTERESKPRHVLLVGRYCNFGK